MGMFHFTGAEEAKQIGFTNHASYYFIPMWVEAEDEDIVMWDVKWYPMEFPFYVILTIEAIILMLFFQEAAAHIRILEEIE
jgi:hypothetical protein